NAEHLRKWYKHLTIFMYIIFSSWSIIFVINIQYDEYNLHYIAIFTQLGASVVASTLLVSDKKLFVPIIFTLMLPLSLYFFMIGTWFGYVLSIFSLIFVAVLLYAAYNTNKLIQDNYYQAQHDILTGLYNRRYFMEYMQPLNERLLEYDKIAYLYLIDLDHFKTINDSLGHEIGDKLLIQVANRIKEYCKDTHVLARLGGDEFILVSREQEKNVESESDAYAFANNLLAQVQKGLGL
ncbi:diguanylate cyclase, partial [cyanobacterium G8-9]